LNADPKALLPAASGRTELWPVRPISYSPAVKAVNRGLNLLPWPWGEDMMALLGVVQAFARVSRLRRALRWAAAQPGARGRWGLALSLLSHHGRFIAMEALVGIREPEALRRHLIVEGEEHLIKAAEKGGTLLLGFHLGPSHVPLALRVIGHRVTLVGDLEHSGRRPGATWLPFLNPSESLSISGRKPGGRLGGLYQARRLLLDGGTLFITADGPFGSEAFRVPLPGGAMVIRSGWLALRGHTRAPTLPVLTYLDGRKRVVTIHAALPAVEADPARDMAVCRAALSPLLEEYVQRFPEQCRSLAFWS